MLTYDQILECTAEYRFLNQTQWEEFLAMVMGTNPNQAAGLVQQMPFTLTAAQIKTLNSLPVDFIPAPGPGKAIEIVSGSVKNTFNTTAFSNTDLQFITDGASFEQAQTLILNVTATSFKKITDAAVPGNSVQIIDNKKILLKSSSDSVVGDGSVKGYISYRIITL